MVGGEARPALRRQLRDGRPDGVDVLVGQRQRGEVRFGEVPVVGRLLLGAAGRRRPGGLVEVPGLLDDLQARVQPGGLPDDLVPDRPLHRAQRVEVLGLRPGAVECGGFPRGGAWTQRHVGVAAQRALLHPDVGDGQRPAELTQLVDVGAGDLGRADVRLGDDLDQRYAGPVVVDQRVGGPVDAPGGPADMQGLAGVLLHVDAGDADPVDLPVGLHVEPAILAQRLVVLADLEVLRHVRVEVVLARETAPR